ncbi:MAG: single-stranded DNA-binding protein [Candidatus Komeilibacteria bacterium]
MNLNKVLLIGNVTADPVAKKTNTGMDLCTFRLATNYSWRDRKSKEMRETAEFHRIIAWGKLADIISNYVKKGSLIYIEGRLTTRSWEDKNGNKRYLTEIVANNLLMLGHRQQITKNQPEELAGEDIAVEEVDVEDLD